MVKTELYLGQRLNKKEVNSCLENVANKLCWRKTKEFKWGDSEKSVYAIFKGIVLPKVQLSYLEKSCDRITIETPGFLFDSTYDKFLEVTHQSAINSLVENGSGYVLNTPSELCQYFRSREIDIQSCKKCFDSVYQAAYDALNFICNRSGRLLASYDTLMLRDDVPIEGTGKFYERIDTNKEDFHLIKRFNSPEITEKLIFSIRNLHKHLRGGLSEGECFRVIRHLEQEKKKIFSEDLRSHFFYESSRNCKNKNSTELNRVFQTLNMYHFMVKMLKKTEPRINSLN